MKNLYFPLHSLINLASGVFSLVVWASQWKARTLRLNIKACGLAPTLGPFFLLRWYFNACRFFLLFVCAAFAFPVRIRSRDSGKLEMLRTQPSLLLTGHFHYWEYLASWFSRTGVPLLGSARPLSSPWFQAWLQKVRRCLGIQVVSQSVLSTAMSHLRKGHCFGILWDQFSWQSRHSSTLFGIPAAMDPLPEVLVKRLQPAVLVAFLLPTGTLRLFHIHASGRPLSDPGKLSRRFHRILEGVVQAYPASWYGLAHARFKDSLDYGSSRNVSRETSVQLPAPEQNVSRETLSSGMPEKAKG